MTRDALRSTLYDVTQEAQGVGEREVIEDLLTLAVIYAVPHGITEEELLTYLSRTYTQCARILPTQKSGPTEAKA